MGEPWRALFESPPTGRRRGARWWAALAVAVLGAAGCRATVPPVSPGFSAATRAWWAYDRPVTHDVVRSPIEVPVRDGTPLACTLYRPPASCSPGSTAGSSGAQAMQPPKLTGGGASTTLVPVAAPVDVAIETGPASALHLPKGWER